MSTKYNSIGAMLRDTADAIRTVDGTTAPINTEDIPDRIRKMESIRSTRVTCGASTTGSFERGIIVPVSASNVEIYSKEKFRNVYLIVAKAIHYKEIEKFTGNYIRSIIIETDRSALFSMTKNLKAAFYGPTSTSDVKYKVYVHYITSTGEEAIDSTNFVAQYSSGKFTISLARPDILPNHYFKPNELYEFTFFTLDHAITEQYPLGSLTDSGIGDPILPPGM